MAETILKIQIERAGEQDENIFRDTIKCVGSQVEVLGMISKARIILNQIEQQVHAELKVPEVKQCHLNK